jgi:hypothetical protein
VVLNVSHSISDGGYLKFLTEQLFEPVPASLPKVPPTLEQLFEEEYCAAPDIALPPPYDPVLNRISTHHSSLQPASPWCKFETLRFRGDDIQCFDPKLKKFNDTTDYIWLAFLLASCVHRGSLTDFAGISTCVDLRARLKKSPSGYAILKFFSVLNAHTVTSPAMTLREIGRRMRADMRRRESELEDIARMKYCERVCAGPAFPGLTLGITNMGPLRIRWPIADAWAEVRVARGFAETMMTVMGFSVMGERKNVLVVRLRFADSKFGEDEAFEMAKSMGHVMRNISLERTLKSAFDELIQIKGM